MSENFRQDLAEVINRHSRENGSDTPDFLLADYLADCLRIWDQAIAAREHWYGRKLHSEEGEVKEDGKEACPECGSEELEEEDRGRDRRCLTCGACFSSHLAA